jgi:hypothetical protein
MEIIRDLSKDELESFSMDPNKKFVRGRIVFDNGNLTIQLEAEGHIETFDAEMVVGMSPTTCKRCSHEWIRRRPDLPKTCPKCKSPYWNKPRIIRKDG